MKQASEFDEGDIVIVSYDNYKRVGIVIKVSSKELLDKDLHYNPGWLLPNGWVRVKQPYGGDISDLRDSNHRPERLTKVDISWIADSEQRGK